MIYECPQDHIFFSKDSLDMYGIKGCGRITVVISPIDIKWFYEIVKHNFVLIGANYTR
jgi:hypothetical protein